MFLILLIYLLIILLALFAMVYKRGIISVLGSMHFIILATVTLFTLFGVSSSGIDSVIFAYAITPALLLVEIVALAFVYNNFKKNNSSDIDSLDIKESE